MSSQKLLSIIVVNYNQEILTSNCLDSIYKNAGGLNPEIILVDNGSRPGSLDGIKNKFPGVTCLDLPENAGFGRAGNMGAARASGEILLFLNNDALVTPGALEKMTVFLQSHPEAGGCGAHLIDGQGHPDLGAADRPTFRQEVLAALGLDRFFRKNKYFSLYYRNYLPLVAPQAVAVISGADLMVKKEIFDQLAGFDENLFFYYEDTDLCLRINSVGYRLYYLPEVTIIHARGATIGDYSRRKFLQWRQSRLYFYKKHYSRAEFSRVRSFMLFTLALRFIIFPVFWLASVLGLKNNLEKYSLYFEAWQMVKNYA